MDLHFYYTPCIIHVFNWRGSECNACLHRSACLQRLPNEPDVGEAEHIANTQKYLQTDTCNIVHDAKLHGTENKAHSI